MATDVTDQARRVYGVTRTQRTARNILIRYKLFARRPASVPLLQERHRRLRKKFALAHRNWTVERWGTILFSTRPSSFSILPTAVTMSGGHQKNAMRSATSKKLRKWEPIAKWAGICLKSQTYQNFNVFAASNAMTSAL
jgi:hypothetical protein